MDGVQESGRCPIAHIRDAPDACIADEALDRTLATLWQEAARARACDTSHLLATQQLKQWCERLRRELCSITPAPEEAVAGTAGYTFSTPQPPDRAVCADACDGEGARHLRHLMGVLEEANRLLQAILEDKGDSREELAELHRLQRAFGAKVQPHYCSSFRPTHQLYSVPGKQLLGG